jgi:site-specific DNA-methyltransferase (adenine-specific)
VYIGDPPYSDHVHERVRSSAAYESRSRRRDLGFDSLSEGLRLHVAAVAARCRWAVIFSDFEGVHLWREAFDSIKGYRYLRTIPWIRWSMPQLSGDRPPQGAEAIVLAAPEGKLSWNGPGNLTHFNELAERGDDKHTTAKPLDLMLRLVTYFSNPGELIIDLTAGRGTTLVAAELLGREGLGVEIQQSEAVLAQLRLAALPELDERDAERLQRFEARDETERADMERMREATNKTRIKKGLQPK